MFTKEPTPTAVLFVESSYALRAMLARELAHHDIRVCAAPIDAPIDAPMNAPSNTARPDETPGAGRCAALVECSRPEAECVAAIHRLHASRPGLPVILLAEPSTPLWVLDAVRGEIAQFALKPVDAAGLAMMIQATLEDHAAGANPTSGEAANSGWRPVSATRPASSPGAGGASAPSEEEAIPCLMGESALMRRLRGEVARAAASVGAVALEGERGVGKRFIARRIHAASPRALAARFMVVNCPAVPRALLESELFGHEAGAFSGADVARPGRLEMASRGVVYLNEAAELPLDVQERLAGAMRLGSHSRVGGCALLPFEARLIVAWGASPARLLREGRLHPAWLDALAAQTIAVPPLREHSEDIPLLADHFLRFFGAPEGARRAYPAASLSRAALAALMRYDWPGNIGELAALMRRRALGADEREIMRAIEMNLGGEPAHAAGFDARRAGGALSVRGSLLDRHEIEALLAILAQTRWNQRRAAQILGISYSALRRRVEKYGLKIDHPAAAPDRSPSALAEAQPGFA